MEVGSMADWFSGIVTAIGISLSVYFSLTRGRLKFQMKVAGRGNYDLVYSIINRSGFDVEASRIMLSFRGHRFKKTEFSKYFERMPLKKYRITLKSNEIHQQVFQLDTIVANENKKRKLNGGKIPFEDKLLNFDVNEFKKRKKFYVVLEVIAQDGIIYRSRPKKLNLSDITFLKNDEDWSEIYY